MNYSQYFLYYIFLKYKGKLKQGWCKILQYTVGIYTVFKELDASTPSLKILIDYGIFKKEEINDKNIV